MTWQLAFIVAALVAFILATFSVPSIGRIQWVPLGFALLTIYYLLQRFASSGS